MYMTKLRATLSTGLAFCIAMLAVGRAEAQLTAPAAKLPDGATLFKQQCATCHITNASDPPRQGPTLFDIVGREAGTVEVFAIRRDLPRQDSNGTSRSSMSGWPIRRR